MVFRVLGSILIFTSAYLSFIVGKEYPFYTFEFWLFGIPIWFGFGILAGFLFSKSR